MKFASALSAACLLPCLALLPHAAMSAPAPITLRCHQDYVFKPHLPDVDLVPGSITSSDPTVAKGSAGRVGIGTAGAIEIDAQGTSGEATITYQVQYADGTIQTIKVKVKVNCPEPQPQPQPRPQPHPQPPPPPPPPHLPPPPTTPPPPPSSGPSEGSTQTTPKGGTASVDDQQRDRRTQIRECVDQLSHFQGQRHMLKAAQVLRDILRKGEITDEDFKFAKRVCKQAYKPHLDPDLHGGDDR